VAPEVGGSRRFCLDDEIDAAENGGPHRDRPGQASGEVQWCARGRPRRASTAAGAEGSSGAGGEQQGRGDAS
jgi:hypothetical protein